MGLIVRENTQPIATGETGDANEMELEIGKIFDAINGGLDDSNVVSGANIVVSTKCSDLSLPGDRFVDGSLTLTEIASTTLGIDNLDGSAAIQCYESLATTSDSTGVDTGYQNIPGIAEWNVVPHSLSNFLYMSFSHSVSAKKTLQFKFTFSIRGIDGSDLAAQSWVTRNTTHMVWAETAPIETALTIKPVAAFVSGTSGAWGRRQFTAMIIPIK